MHADRPLVLRGATVIDGWSRNPRPNTTLLIRNQHITAMGTGDEVGVPDGAEVVDLHGRWIIPGLIDMHCHIKEGFAPDFVSAGVTTVRNTAGNLKELRRLRMAPPDAPTPRVISADRIIDGPPGMWPGGTGLGQYIASDAEGARAEVRTQIELGTDLVKVYSLLSPTVAQAVAEEAAAHGVPTSCDIAYATEWNIRDGARWGYRWNEHATGFLQALYPEYNQRDPVKRDVVPWDQPGSPELDALCAEIVDRGMLLCPTMSIFEQAHRLPDYWWRDTPAGRHTLQLIGGQWEQIAAHPNLKAFGRLAGWNQAIARSYRAAGGVVVVGTDSPASVYTAPGNTMHLELELFVANGWSPMEALMAATGVPAAAMGRTDIGVVRPGAWADLVILTADPLADIRNTMSIETVVKGGRRFTPEEPLQYLPTEEELVAAWEKLKADYERNGR